MGRKINIDQILISALTVGIIFLGPGRIITIGAITDRYILLALIMIRLIFLFRGSIVINNSNRILFVMISYFIVLAGVSAILYPVGNVVSEFGGYATIIVCPYFIFYFSKYPNKVYSWILLFRKCSLILAVLQIILYLYCVIKGIGVYPSVNGFLKRYDIGFIDFFGTGMAVRVYLKGAITYTAALMFEEQNIIQNHNRFWSILRFLVLFVALITTFSMAIYVFSYLMIILMALSHVNRKKRGKIILGIAFVIITMFYFVVQTNIINTLMSRYTGSYNAVGYRMAQILSGLDDLKNHLAFGTGFGKQIRINDGLTTRFTHVFEVMWVQLVVHTGLVGGGLFISHIMITINNLNRRARRYKKAYFSLFKWWVIYICLVSFTNPYMNGNIGLGFYAIITGISYMNIEQDCHLNMSVSKRK